MRYLTIAKAPKRPFRLPKGWVWDDKLPFYLRACSSTDRGYVELWPTGHLHAKSAPKAVIDAIYARLDAAEIQVPEPATRDVAATCSTG